MTHDQRIYCNGEYQLGLLVVWILGVRDGGGSYMTPPVELIDFMLVILLWLHVIETH